MKKFGDAACKTVFADANFGSKAVFSGKVTADDDGKCFVGDLAETALLGSEWLYIEGYLLTDDDRAAIKKELVTKVKVAGDKVALRLSDSFDAQIFADNLWRCD